MTKYEVMAPVGSWEMLAAALNAGADSVYFGIEQLNMRARSSINFTLEDLKEIANKCHEKNVKTYLTLNTIVYNHDVNLMKMILDTAKNSGIDAVIAADFAVIQYANEIGLSVHVSTQANITNFGAVKFFSQFADVMVLSRECTLKQVKEICSQVKEEDIRGPNGELVGIEIFVHGALCMAVSGKCYLSLHTANSSANRGACKQNCRRKYTVKDDEGNELQIDNEYIMSPKDLCTIDFLDKVVDAGVNVLKIEGRGKSPDYVKTVVECYREALDAIQDGTYNQAKIDDWMTRLSTVFNRGFWDGYYLGRKLGEWHKEKGSLATKKKIQIGVCTNYFKKTGIAEFKMEAGEVNTGDEILITGVTTGAYQTKINDIMVEGEMINKANKGDVFTVKMDLVRENDKLFRIDENNTSAS